MDGHADAEQEKCGIMISATGCQLRISVKNDDQTFIDELFMCLVDLVSANASIDASCCVSSYHRNLLVEMDHPSRQLLLTLFRQIVDEVNRTEYAPRHQEF